MKKNVLTAGKKLKGDQAAKSGDLLQAQALFSSVCKLDPMDAEAWVKLALVEKGLGNYRQAEQCARRALVLNPNLGYGHFALGQALHSQMHRPHAIVSYRTATKLMPDFAEAHYLLGLVLHEHGAMSEAVSCLQHALRLRPTFSEALAEIGAVHIDLGQVDTGMDYLQHASALRPFDAVVMGNIGHALRLQGKNQAAVDKFRSAVQLDPDNVDLIAGLAGLLEKAGKAEEAESLTGRSLELAPTHAMSNLIAAQLDRRKQRLQPAAARLEGLLTTPMPVDLSADISLELGQIYDQMGDAARAYPLIVEGKRKKAMATLSDDLSVSSSIFLNRLEQIQKQATPALASALQEKMSLNKQEYASMPAPVFLIGFPRSGTTLMEQILDSHSNVQTLEEKSTATVTVNCALSILKEQQCLLTDLSSGQLSELRQLYFSEVGRHISLSQGNVVVDKLPLNTISVPVIAAIFPNAKFILAIRHPCDVSLSCLMQNFAVNAAMVNFLTLEDTVNFYAKVMRAWLHYAELLPLNYHQVRYEDLIEDVPAQTHKLLDFLGLPWDDAVLKHTEHARQREAINTPSYHQVVQPVYQRSKYRWKRYEKQLADVLPVLQPFIEKFGYA
jgi:tetratricopeptide (TPR) repeat protein